MKRFTSALLLLTGLIEVTVGQNTWTQKANFPGTARRSAIGFSNGINGYMGTGYSGNFFNDLWKYDQSANSWTPCAFFPGTARFSAVSFVAGGNGYVGTGYDLNNTFYTGDFWKYDPVLDSWNQVASMPVVAERRYGCAFGIENKGYVGTGVGAAGYMNDFWEYDASQNIWIQKTNFPGAPRYECVSFTIGEYGYIGCGAFAGTIYTDFYEYDPAADTWTQKSNFPGTGGDAPAGFSIGKMGYIGTGSTQGSFPVDFYEWDQVNDTWTQKATFPAPGRAFGTGFSFSGKGYIGLGEGGNYFNDFWEYTPDTLFSGISESTNDILPSIVFSADQNQIFIFNGKPGDEISIFDSKGKLVYKRRILFPLNGIHLDFANGVYFYSMERENGALSGKLMISRQ